MFYSQFILSKHGPLGTIWIAAHLERRLRKNQITQTSISDSVDSILYPEVPIALRLSGHLLLGVVRIYSRKVNYLFHDCSEALIKMQQAFYTSAVNLPPGAVVAPYHSITLPESFDFYELEAQIDRETASKEGRRSEFEHHVTPRDLITLQEGDEDHSYFQSVFTLEERFSGGENPYAIMEMYNEEVAPQRSGSSKPVSLAPRPDDIAALNVEEDVLPPLPIEEDMDLEALEVYEDEGTHRVHGAGSLDVHKGSSAIPVLNEDLEPQDKAPQKEEAARTLVVTEIERLRAATDFNQPDFHIGEVDGDEMDVEDEPLSIIKGSGIGIAAQSIEETPLVNEETSSLGSQRSLLMSPWAACENIDIMGIILGGRTPKLEVIPTPTAGQDGRKRKQIFDDMIALSSSTMKKQLKSTSDICRARRKAPSTEYEIWMSRRDSHMEQIFLEPSIPGMCAELKGISNRVFSGRHRLPAKDLQPDLGTSKIEADQTREAQLDIDAVKVVKNLGGGPGVDNPVHQVAAQDSEIEALSTFHAAQQADSLKEKAVDVADEAQLSREPFSATPQLPVDSIVPGRFENGTEIIEEVRGARDYFQNTSAQKEKETGNGPAASVEPQQDCLIPIPVAEMPQVLFEAATPQGLGFLADSWGTDEAVHEVHHDYNQMDDLFENDAVWSSHTRAVAKYLKERFQVMETARKPGPDQDAKLSLERLLSGRTQREAARLFFETLVLATKDYLQVEQDLCSSDIRLFATQRLLKAVI